MAIRCDLKGSTSYITRVDDSALCCILHEVEDPVKRHHHYQIITGLSNETSVK